MLVTLNYKYLGPAILYLIQFCLSLVIDKLFSKLQIFVFDHRDIPVFCISSPTFFGKNTFTVYNLEGKSIG